MMAVAQAPAPRHWMVTGTDTGVGKTLVTAGLLAALVERGQRAVGMKPVAAGARWLGGAWRNDDVEMLARAGNVDVPVQMRCPYLLPDPIAPHIAAERAGVQIRLEPLLLAYAQLCTQADTVVVEGVGGFCVPLSPGFGTADLARALGLPVILVVGLRLGCLNHAALSAEAIRARGLHLAAWVANAIDPQMAEVQRNLETLQQIIAAPRLGRIPWLEQAEPALAARWLDPDVLAPRP